MRNLKYTSYNLHMEKNTSSQIQTTPLPSREEQGGGSGVLLLYNTLSRQKELFRPLTPGRVGMYVCGPTVYGSMLGGRQLSARMASWKRLV